MIRQAMIRRLRFRRIFLRLAALAMLAPAAAVAQSASVPTLRPAVTVAGDLVRIGDLVENAGPAAGIAVFRSPDIGTTGHVPVTQVMDALRNNNLILVDTRNLAEIEVARAGRAVTGREIERRIARAFAGKYGLGDEAALSVTLDRQVSLLPLESGSLDLMQVLRTTYDPRVGRFDIAFQAPRGGVMRFSGALAETVDVAVLTRPLARGDQVRAADVAIERRPKAEVTADIAHAAEEVVGFAVRSPMRAGIAIRRSELMKPERIRRDETVMLLYRVPGITITTQGKAVESGSDGDVVTVLNIQSKRTVRGVVTGAGQVTILPTNGVFAATADATAGRSP